MMDPVLNAFDISTKLRKTDCLFRLQVNSRLGKMELSCILLCPLQPTPHCPNTCISPPYHSRVCISLTVICPWMVTLIFSNSAYCLLQIILFWHSWTYFWEQMTSVSFNCCFFLSEGEKKNSALNNWWLELIRKEVFPGNHFEKKHEFFFLKQNKNQEQQQKFFS